MRLNLSEESVLSSKDALEVIFPNRKTRTAARLFVDWLKERGGNATKSSVSQFANNLESGVDITPGTPFNYSRRNFYVTIIRNLIKLGFLQRNVPVWDERRGATHYVYQRNLFDIPLKPPGVGFWRIAYYVCRRWNEDFKPTVAEEVNSPAKDIVPAQRVKRQPLRR